MALTGIDLLARRGRNVAAIGLNNYGFHMQVADASGPSIRRLGNGIGIHQEKICS